MQILVTGANGFIGRHLTHHLRQAGHHVIACVRQQQHADETAIGDVAAFDQWSQLLTNIDCVMHLAGRVHQTSKQEAHNTNAFTRDNVHVTQRLLDACSQHSVRHVIFLSTIAVLGYDSGDTLFTSDTSLAPYNPYSVSKAQAEALFDTYPLPYTIIRVPLTYGANVRANFYTLLKAVSRQVPLPFGRIHNQRSVLYVGNLTHAMEAIACRESCYGQTLLLDDGAPVSSQQLIRAMAQALSVRPHLLPMPANMMQTATKMIGRPELYHKLCGTLAMDSTESYRMAGTSPPYSMEAGLQDTARWFTQNP